MVLATTGQLEEQNPQLPWPPTWSSFESVSVEHHGSVSPAALPSKVHSLYTTPLNLNGNTQDLPGSAPLTVVQPVDGEVVGGGFVCETAVVVVVVGVVVVVVEGGFVGETVVPDRLLGHSVVPVVDLTQSITSGS